MAPSDGRSTLLMSGASSPTLRIAPKIVADDARPRAGGGAFRPRQHLSRRPDRSGLATRAAVDSEAQTALREFRPLRLICNAFTVAERQALRHIKGIHIALGPTFSWTQRPRRQQRPVPSCCVIQRNRISLAQSDRCGYSLRLPTVELAPGESHPFAKGDAQRR